MAKPLNLQLGWPSTRLYPAADLLYGASSTLESQEKTAAALIYGPDAGHQPLRQSIASWLNDTYKPKQSVTSSNICITHGASGNLLNMLSKFTLPGYTRRIWMIEPCYFRACAVFTDAGYHGRLRGVPEDEEGINIGFLRSAISAYESKEAAGEDQFDRQKYMPRPASRYPKMYRHVIYVVPTFANPSGKTMSLKRREELVRIAREFDALVITDDVYDLLRWPEHPGVESSQLSGIPPRLIDIDRTLDGGPTNEFGNTVSNGSFAKIIAPGVRTGWADASPPFIKYISEFGANQSGGCPSQGMSTFVCEMLDSGRLKKHINDVLLPTYRTRYTTMRGAIGQHLEPLGYRVSTGIPYERSSMVQNGTAHDLPLAAGGYFINVLIPKDLPTSAVALAAYALEKYNLRVAPGAMMLVEGDPLSEERAAGEFGRAIRLCWAWHEEKEIKRAIEILATATKDIFIGKHIN